ncbi:MFS transporter [Pseudomonas syringae pv. actinidiae]|nr:MFS transporter [Pseudomonas syringae pv. actinidiae]
MVRVDEGKSRSQKIICLSALFLAWAVGYVDRIVMSTAIIPIGKEFALDAQQLGLVLSSFYVSYAIMQLFGGWMSDRFGSRIVVVTCVVAWSLFTGMTALAWSFASLVVIRFIFGMGEGCFSPASSVTVAEVFPKNERGRAKSFLISTVYLGSAVGSGLVAVTVAYFGWRSTFVGLAAAGLMVSAILWFALKSGISEQRARETVSGGFSQIKELFKNPAALKLSAIWFSSTLLSIGMLSWMPSFLIKQFNVDLLHAGLASAVPYLVAFLSTNFAGWMLDKVGGKYEKHFMAFGALGCALFLSLMITTTSMALSILYWSFCLISFNFIYSTVFSVPLKRFDSAVIGSATGLVNFFGQVGAALAPTIMGSMIVAFNGSYFAAFWFLVACAFVAFFLALTWKTPDALAFPAGAQANG